MTSENEIARVSPAVSDDAQHLERLATTAPPATHSQRCWNGCWLAPARAGNAPSLDSGSALFGVNMTVASAQIQKARAGEFINCAHCVIFLYHDRR
jgi:hypothetical protein